MLAAFSLFGRTQAREPIGDAPPLGNIKVAVDEVGLTFHAADVHGLPVNDLQLDELTLLDDGKPPQRIVSFSTTQNAAIRVGILLDTSESMAANLGAARSISSRFAQRVLRQTTDQAFVLTFGYISRIAQSWTNHPDALSTAVSRASIGHDNPLGGTALYDTLFRACYYLFGQVNTAENGNVILLFSDGQDNSSHTSLEEVVDVCQHSNTAIYAFRAEPNSGMFATGSRDLAELAEKTGGRIFPLNESDAAIDSDLRIIETNLRNQYRLIYNPPVLKHDGAFHRIELHTPSRVASVTIRSGYYDRPR